MKITPNPGAPQGTIVNASTAVAPEDETKTMNLPLLNSAFVWSDETWGVGLRCQRLEPLAQHLFTTRQLRLRGGAERAWEEATTAVGGVMRRLLRVRQVHGSVVRVIHDTATLEREAANTPEADAIVSNAAEAVLAVQVADCVPILMADARLGAVAAVHAGWRGTAARVAHVAVDTMQREFGTRPADLVVAVGPSIGPCCYDVGAELIDAFRGRGASEVELARWFSRAADDSLRLDLWSASRDQLADSGIDPSRIHVANVCTKSHVDMFDSYRVDGPNAGRTAALIRCAR